MYSKILLGLIFTCLLEGSTALAQAPPAGAVALSPGAKAGAVTMRVDAMDIEPAKGAPFCATFTTEHIQAFVDGNRIHTSDSSSVCRDSEGRTRREASLNLLGAAAPGAAPRLVTIVDPVAGYRYILDSESKTAHRIPIGPGAMAGRMKGAFAGSSEKGEHVMLYQSVGTAGPSMAVGGNIVFRSSGQTQDALPPSTENLGDQTIDGIHATGTRLVTTIPAGRIGNEQPILVTSERWYSPALKAAIMTKHSDPWAGELTTHLTDVSTSEPEASLFQVPGDYQIVDDQAGPFLLEKQVLAPPPPH
jgi:hypothetical protein